MVNGQIIGPDGQPFIGKGINVDGTLSNAEENTILQDFPGLNFIRLATGPSGAPFSGNGTTFDGSDSVSQIQQFIDTMTAHGIVVEVENHNSGHVPTGQDVTSEDNWISQDCQPKAQTIHSYGSAQPTNLLKLMEAPRTLSLSSKTFTMLSAAQETTT